MNTKRFAAALLSGALAISMLSGCSRSLIQTYISGSEPVTTVTGNETAANLETWLVNLNDNAQLTPSVLVRNSIDPKLEERPIEFPSSGTSALHPNDLSQWLNKCYEAYQNPYSPTEFFYMYEKLGGPCSYEELEAIQLSRISQIVSVSQSPTTISSWIKAINQYAETNHRDTVYIYIITSVREEGGTTDSYWAETGLYIG